MHFTCIALTTLMCKMNTRLKTVDRGSCECAKVKRLSNGCYSVVIQYSLRVFISRCDLNSQEPITLCIFNSFTENQGTFSLPGLDCYFFTLLERDNGCRNQKTTEILYKMRKRIKAIENFVRQMPDSL